MNFVLTGRVTGLNGQCIDEQAHVDDVAFRAVGIGQLVGRETMRVDERGVDLVKHVCPDFSDCYSSASAYTSKIEEIELTVHFVGGLEALVRQGVGGLGHGVGELADAGNIVVEDVSSHDIVQGILRDLVHPTERQWQLSKYRHGHREKLTKPSHLPIPRQGLRLPKFAGNGPFLHQSGDW